MIFYCSSLFIVFTLIFSVGNSQAAKTKAKELTGEKVYQIDDKKLGSIFVDVNIIDEPASTPVEVVVKIKCKNSDARREVKRLKVCLFKKQSYDKVGQVLSIFYNFGEVEEDGTVLCQSSEVEEIKLAKSCL